jgi:hypothetical protein
MLDSLAVPIVVEYCWILVPIIHGLRIVSMVFGTVLVGVFGTVCEWHLEGIYL